MIKVFSEEWLAHLARRVLPLVNEQEQEWVLESLAKRPAVATNRLLLEIAESDPLTVTLADENSDLPSLPKLSNAMHAILAAARNQVSDCRTVIVRRLAEKTDPEVRLALEVALAQFDGPAVIKPAHLQSEIGDVAEMAWQTVSKDPSTQVSIETLIALAMKPGRYEVSEGAGAKLQDYGLRVMTERERATAIINQPRFKKAETLAEIDAGITEFRKTFANRKADRTERLVLEALAHRKGRLLLQSGEYQQAVPLLEGGYVDHKLYSDQAFALQTLGRFSDASLSINRSANQAEEEAVAKQLVRRGYLAFAEGEFENATENLTAAKTIRVSLLEEGPLALIQYLCGVLSGKTTAFPSNRYLSISDSGEVGAVESDLNEVYWPESGSFYLHGKLTEAEVFARIEKHEWKKAKHLCEAHFVFSALCRAKGDTDGELKHLESALATKAYTNQCFSLATVRFRELSAAKK